MMEVNIEVKKKKKYYAYFFYCENTVKPDFRSFARL